jgi:hypothetical protein
MLLYGAISAAEVVQLNVVVLHVELRKSLVAGVWFLGSVLEFFCSLS